MELILNTNELGYKPFLSTNVDTVIIGLKDFCINQPFSLALKDLPLAVKELQKNNKKVCLSINIFANEKDVCRFKKLFNKLKEINIDSYIISDLGILNIFKEQNLEHKVTLDLQTYVTNKYSTKSLLNLGVNSISLSKEITLNDIKEIAFSNKNKVQLLVQGYYPITYSKRPILSLHLKNFKLKNKSEYYYLKEESRNEFYFLTESKNILSVFNSKQYSLFNYLPELLENNISSLRIDTLFLKEEEIKEYIEFYSAAIEHIKNKEAKEFEKLKNEFNNKFVYDTPFLHNGSFLLKEGK